ncbi:putative membrane protein [Candidatus Protofrankia californiensis]|uniref:Putative membrane protein n=1 Tax=Candidatus Protofrankia californiensis TaxID=1839754 RepID=A0A1C3PFF5_9ACTN|nr:putative membrane protein [Candidatus Protofrankia californiensis]
MLLGLAGAAGAVAAWRSGQGAAATLAVVVAAAGLYLAWAGYAADRRDAQAGPAPCWPPGWSCPSSTGSTRSTRSTRSIPVAATRP